MKVFEDTCINEFKVYEKMLATLIYILDKHIEKVNSIKNNNKSANNKISDS